MCFSIRRIKISHLKMRYCLRHFHELRILVDIEIRDVIQEYNNLKAFRIFQLSLYTFFMYLHVFTLTYYP